MRKEKKLKVGFRKFYEGAAGSAAKALGGEEAGLGPHLLKRVEQRTLVRSGNRAKNFSYIAESWRAKLNPLEPASPSYQPGLTRK